MTMKSFLVKLIIFLVIVSLIPASGLAKKKKDKKDKPVYQFTIETEVARTKAKPQDRTGTCWCFATVSYLESELLRMGKEEIDLSEMYIVRHTYPAKALNYVQMHGDANFSQGGQAHDVLETAARSGMAPESVYTGKNINENIHNHGEMVAALKGMLDGVLAGKRRRKVTPRWPEAITAVLDIYLGKSPESFEYKGKTYTPQSFFKDYMQLNPDDYIELTSYSHHPYYKKCRLELPDNWNYNSNYYNLPIDDFEKVVDHALKSGHSVVWDGDVSERLFNPGRSQTGYGKGYIIVPLKDLSDMTREERRKEKEITEPVKEIEITQELRQETFNNMTTTDDHLMHFVGIAKDQTGGKFYLVKNSGGEDRVNKGYYYMSRAFFRLKTTALMIHKDALPADIKQKLGL